MDDAAALWPVEPHPMYIVHWLLADDDELCMRSLINDNLLIGDSSVKSEACIEHVSP